MATDGKSMTTFFEVLERDGPARLGEIRLDTPQLTPAMAGDTIVDAGSRWSGDPSTPVESDEIVTILPHRGFPPGTPTEIVDAFTDEPSSVDFPHGVVIEPARASDHGADVYALSTSQGIVGHARAFAEAIVSVRESIPDDSGLFLSGVARPDNVALLAWAGVDIVDDLRARIAGSQGTYLLPHGSTPLTALEELPCACTVCSTGLDGFDRSDCIAHNVATLRAELATVRERIRAGRLRELLEGRCRHTPWVTSALREFDQQYDYVETRTPMFRSARIDATTDDALQRVEIRRFGHRLDERYSCRFTRPLVLLPCSARKPYSQSQSHRQFRDVIQYRAHRVALSSPVGVVPQELECTYPAQHYDTSVTGRWSASEIEFVADQLEAYLKRHEYSHIIAHVPEGGYGDVVRRAATAADVEPVWTVADHPTGDASLAALADELDGELAYSRYQRRHNTVRAIADYQFGRGAGEELFPDVTIEAPYPKHRVLDGDGTHLATMVPEYGLLALTLAGGRHWDASPLDVRQVEINDFVPHGDVLAPGVVSATEDIRVGDEVVVSGPSAYGVGRACMHGRALEESTRGIAVDLRHSTER